MSQRRYGLLYLAAALLATLAASPASAQTVDDFEARTYTDGVNTIPYRLFIPADYDPNQSYPLVLFLHGAGERGTDNRRQLSVQTAPLVFARPENQKRWPCFMMAPQCPNNGAWANLGQPNPTTWMRLTLEALAGLMKEFRIQPGRLYITGLSMGGYGTWDTICRYPGLFAAAVPICGGGDVRVAANCAATPIWAFHGSADATVPVERSREMIAAVIAAGGEPLYTEYPGVGHNSWDRAYREIDLLPWMFAQGTVSLATDLYPPEGGKAVGTTSYEEFNSVPMRLAAAVGGVPKKTAILDVWVLSGDTDDWTYASTLEVFDGTAAMDLQAVNGDFVPALRPGDYLFLFDADTYEVIAWGAYGPQ